MKVKDSGLKIVNNYPIKGIKFIDISNVLANPTTYNKVINSFCRQVQKIKKEYPRIALLSPESRGFLFASAVAYKTKLPLIVVRKKGKVPNKPYRFQIQNEYDAYEMEVDSDFLSDFKKYIFIDDILATGQTLACISEALKKKDKEIVLALHLTAVPGLKQIRKENKKLQQISHKEIIK